MIEAQLNNEKKMFSLCEDKFFNRFETEKEKNFGNSQTASLIIKRIVSDYANEIQRQTENILSGNPAKHTVAVKCLSKIGDYKKIAFITLKTIFNLIYQKPTLQKVISGIANSLEDEFAFENFKRKNKPYYEKIIKDLNQRNAHLHWKKTVLTYKFAEKEKFYTSKWSASEKHHTGLFLFEILLPFNVIETNYIYEKGKTTKYVLPTNKFLEIIENLNNNLKSLSLTFEPMLCQPKEWTGIFEGGYLTPIRKCKFIKHNDKNYLDRAEKFGLENCYGAVNLIQNTAWRINKKILNVVTNMWEKNISSGGLPNREDVIIPSFPYPDKPKSELTQEQKEEIKQWKQFATQQYRKNIQLRSVRLSTVQIINTAQKYAGFERIYYPYQLDFRGRIYPIPILLQPQGCDLAKGLLTFADGKPLDENGLKWLKIHCANCWGLSKENYETRLKWVDGNINTLINYADRPISFLDWTKADKPFQFLASCIELAEYNKNPDNFISTLPVCTDGTCNGLQNYSALLLDETAGKSVNLIDSDKPNDIYQVVADNLIEKIHYQNDKILAQKWLSLGINRKLTKRPVMTLVYGATKYSCKDYVKDYLRDNFDINTLHNHFGNIGTSPVNTLNIAGNWLAEILWQSIKECIPSAITAMDYLRNIARLVAKKQRPIEWVTPMGMLVSQSYLSTRQYRINSETAGSIRVYKYRGEISKYDVLKQVNGICPNFVHSLDASCLMLWAHRCAENGIYQYSPVHDSYGVLASDMEMSQKLLRQSFYEIYSTYNVLGKFVEDITSDLTQEEKEKIPPLPEFYNLDLKEVLESKYFFS